MNFKKTMFALAVGSVGIMGSMSAYAVAVNNGDVLTITAGTGTTTASGAVTPTGGSFFRMVGVGAGLLSPGTDGGLKIGTTTSVGQIDAPWSFGGANGQDYVSVPVTGSTTAGLNMSGWTVYWSGNTIPMGTGAWTNNATTFNNGIGNFAWDGVYGHAYTLDYHATVQSADVVGTPAAGFAGVKYNLHMEGVVNAAAPVPEASTYGMMLAGLGLVGFAVRRRKLI